MSRMSELDMDRQTIVSLTPDVGELTYTLKANAEALLRERELGAREIQDVQEAFIALCAILGRKDSENA